MDEYGFELVDSRLFHEVPNSMLEEFYADNKPLGQKLKAKTKALEYSILHRWFIFVKRNPTDKEEDEENEKEENEKEEKEDEENEKEEKDEETKTTKVVVNKNKVKKQSGGYESESETETNTLQIEELDLEKIIV
jgi:cyclic nucleotide gated channel beta 1